MSANPPDSPDTGIAAALDAFEQALIDREKSEFSEEVYSEAEAIADSDVASAYRSVLDLFERLQNRIAEAEERGYQEAKHQYLDDEALGREILKLEAELAALRSTALTRDEAVECLWGLEGGIHAHFTNRQHMALADKLRSLSSLRSSSLGEQK